ncbi:hypothetical protein SSTU70S_07105 [Stutzerimonas stutzeri]
MPLKISRRRLSTVFSSLNSGMPNVSRPPISGLRSNTTGATPLRTSTSAQPKPAGPAPMMATRLPVGLTLDRSGRQPIAKAVSAMYFSTEPIGAEDRRLDHVEAGLEAAVGLHPHLPAQVVAAQGLWVSARPSSHGEPA